MTINYYLHGRGELNTTVAPLPSNSIHLTVNGGSHLGIKRFPLGFINASVQAYRNTFDLVQPTSDKPGRLWKLSSVRGQPSRCCGKLIIPYTKKDLFLKWCFERCDSPLTGLIALSWALFNTPGVVHLLGYTFSYKQPGGHDIDSNKQLLRIMEKEFEGRIKRYE